MSPRLSWRQLLAAFRRARARRLRRAVARLEDKPRLAQELLESLSPTVLFDAGYLRRRVVVRRRVAYARIRTLRG
jgi:hypothetical protein